jgi:hypothetical protein
LTYEHLVKGLFLFPKEKFLTPTLKLTVWEYVPTKQHGREYALSEIHQPMYAMNAIPASF